MLKSTAAAILIAAGVSFSVGAFAQSQLETPPAQNSGTAPAKSDAPKKSKDVKKQSKPSKTAKKSKSSAKKTKKAGKSPKK